MPEGIELVPMTDVLTFEEIAAVCSEAVHLGINKMKITGGEPLVRKGICDLIAMIKCINGIEQVTLTTNGVLLSDYADKLYKVGIDAVNISLDTLDSNKYRYITGFDCLYKVVDGINKISQYPVKIKINTVITNEPDYSVLDYAKNRDIDVRFIEMMPIGMGRNFNVYSNEKVFRDIENMYGSLKRDYSVRGNGPAQYYSINGFNGRVGFISAIHNKFCNTCNRIRMTSQGCIKGCLCYESSYSVKEPLRKGNLNEVREILKEAIVNKPKCHSFDNPENITEKYDMSEIGG